MIICWFISFWMRYAKDIGWWSEWGMTPSSGVMSWSQTVVIQEKGTVGIAYKFFTQWHHRGSLESALREYLHQGKWPMLYNWNYIFIYLTIPHFLHLKYLLTTFLIKRVKKVSQICTAFEGWELWLYQKGWLIFSLELCRWGGWGVKSEIRPVP